MRAEDSRGRRHAEPEHPYRSVYARDRDRIIHSRAFRRLEATTQVFTTRYSDHSSAEFPQLAEYFLDFRPPLEAQLIDWVDEIAYNTADLDDALEAELLDINALRKEVSFFGDVYDQVHTAYPGAREKLKFNEA